MSRQNVSNGFFLKTFNQTFFREINLQFFLGINSTNFNVLVISGFERKDSFPNSQTTPLEHNKDAMEDK